MSLLDWTTSVVNEHLTLVVYAIEPLDFALVQVAGEVFQRHDSETRGQTWGAVALTSDRVIVREVREETDPKALREYVESGLAAGQRGVARYQEQEARLEAEEARRSEEAAAAAARLTDEFRS